MSRPIQFGIAPLMGIVALTAVAVYALLYTRIFPDILLVVSIILILDLPQRIARWFRQQ